MHGQPVLGDPRGAGSGHVGAVGLVEVAEVVELMAELGILEPALPVDPVVHRAVRVHGAPGVEVSIRLLRGLDAPNEPVDPSREGRIAPGDVVVENSSGNTAMGLWVRAGSHCARHLTDGFVDDDVVLSLGTMKQAERLVNAGLWLRVEGGFQFHEYHADGRNPTRAEVLAKRLRDAERKAKQRAKIQSDSEEAHVSNPSPTGTPGGVTSGVTPGVQASPPLPSLKEEKKKTSSSSSPRKRGTRLPEDFTVSPDMVTWARTKVPQVDGRLETEKFINYWTAKSGRDATKVDWSATWRNWMLSAAERLPAARRASLPSVHPTDAAIARLVNGGRLPQPALRALPGGESA